MLNFNIENQGVNTYLVYKVNPTDEIDTLSLGMLENNKINGVSQIVFTQRDEDKFLKYNISAKIPASQIFGGVVSKKRILSVLSGIAGAVMAAEEYMVDTNLFIYDLEHIYVDAVANDVCLICLPIINSNLSLTDVHTFFKSVVFSSKFDQNENCDYVAKLINYLNSTTVFSLLDFKALVDSLALEHSGVAYSHTPQILTPPLQPSFVEEQKVVNTPPVRKEPPARVKPDPAPIVHPNPVAGVIPSLPEEPKKPKSGFSIPGGKTPAPKKEKKTDEPKEKMSALYLIRHYSKENLEIYKSQKNQDKPAKDNKKPNKDAGKDSSPKVNAGFSIPGQGPSMGNAEKTPAPISYSAPATPRAETTTAARSTPPVSFGETTVLGVAPTAGETTVLNAVASKPMPYLVRVKNNERIVIDKPCFRIGKERSFVDYFIADNTAISRSHADIISNSRGYFIVDRNSTNHTFVNGVAIQSEAEVKIEPGCKIRLANEEFEFVIG